MSYRYLALRTLHYLPRYMFAAAPTRMSYRYQPMYLNYFRRYQDVLPVHMDNKSLTQRKRLR
jgi:hypothetical protein